jgi:excisionase family DNA binding protein
VAVTPSKRGFIVSKTQPDAAASSERLVYSVGEAADLLGISRAFAYELVCRGELPVIRLGRRRLVPKVALLDFVGIMPEGATLG